MRVVQAVSVLPASGGVAGVVVRTALAAKRHGHDVVVVVQHPVGAGNPHADSLRREGIPLLAPARRGIAALEAAAAALGVPFSLVAVLPFALLRRLPVMTAWGKLITEARSVLFGRPRRRYLDRRLVRNLSRACAGEECVIHLHNLGWPGCATTLEWAVGHEVPLIFHLHSDLDATQSDSLGRMFPPGGDDRLVRWPIFAALTPSIAEKLSAFFDGRARVEVISNWVEPPERVTARQAAEEVFTVCYVGRLVGGKGIEDLLRAVARLRAEGEKVEGRIVGDGVGRAYLEDFAARIGARDAVVFEGECGPDETWGLLSASDLVVLASESEGLPLVLLEAYAAGKPVVATVAGGLRDVFVDGRNGIVVDPGDVRSLTEAIRKVMKDRSLAASFGEANRKAYRQDFSEDAVWPRLEGLYRRMAGSEKHGQ